MTTTTVLVNREARPDPLGRGMIIVYDAPKVHGEVGVAGITIDARNIRTVPEGRTLTYVMERLAIEFRVFSGGRTPAVDPDGETVELKVPLG